MEIKVNKGLRNDVREEQYEPGDLARAYNVEIDKALRVGRRKGVASAFTGDCHSLWSNGTSAYLVKDGYLCSLSAALAATQILAVKGARVSYCEVAGRVFWSGDVNSGVLEEGRNRAWGVSPPTTPVLSATYGELRAGRYLVGLTYVRADGVESGASPLSVASLQDWQGLQIGLPTSTNPAVTALRVYVSDANGQECFLAGIALNGAASITISAAPQTTVMLRGRQKGPPPAGYLVGYYNGRMYVGRDNVLFYSEPYEMELFDYATGYMVFPSNVRTFAAVEGGIFLGLENETGFMQGSGPENFVYRQVAPYGTVLGTECVVPGLHVGEGVPGNVVLWGSQQGVCAGFDSGQFKNLTGARYSAPGAMAGASLLKIRGGSPHFIVSLYQ